MISEFPAGTARIEATRSPGTAEHPSMLIEFEIRAYDRKGAILETFSHTFNPPVMTVEDFAVAVARINNSLSSD